ncbi:MAG: protease, partial [Lysobacter sp.]|nr:protease [Lysobacter sp.]
MKSTLVRAAGCGTLLAVAIAAAVAAPPSAKSNPLRVSMYADNGVVEVVVTNASNKIARVPKWQLPSETPQGELFQITLDGRDVEYHGPMIKRGVPTAEDFAILRPGQSHRYLVDLTDSYDMSQKGQYLVTLVSPLQYASLSGGEMLKTERGLPMLLQSAPLRVWVDDSAAKSSASSATARKPPSGGGTVVNGVSYVGCSSTQISTAGSAVNSARSYAENAKGYLNASNVGPRYTTWFGAYASSRYSTATSHFVSIDTAMDQSGGQVKINCGCNQSYYAYVYPNRPYEIFVCRAFWTAPLTGTDSKAGTLIHEMSHFDIVANTDDVVYGQSGAKSLAISDPAGAGRNADS